MISPADVRRRAPDFALGAFAFALGLVSLSYPMARDHALFFYGAREWIERGQVLYRDILDHKPPGIYVIYAVAIELFGKHAWSIRALELLVAVPAVAWIAARLATKRGEGIAPGVFGAAWLGASVLDFGYLSFWDSAQCEIWFTIFATGGLAAAMHVRSFVRACALAGLLSALAVLVKPPCLPFVLITLGAIVVRERRLGPLAIGLAVFGGAGSALGACTLAYYGAKHALPQMKELLVGVNSFQVRNGPGVHDLESFVRESGRFFRDYEPFSGVFLAVALFFALRGFAKKDAEMARRYALPALLALAAWVSVAMQRKFYIYHRASIISAFAVTFALLYQDFAALLANRPAWLTPATVGAFTVVLFALSTDASERWYVDVRNAVRWKTGAIDREEFTRRFDSPGFFAYHDAELTGLWLRAHAPPNDTLIVRGFDPEIYETSGLHYTGRFCWSSFLNEPWRAYHQEEMIAEDLAALRARPPHFAVALAHDPDGVTSARFFERLGYVMRTQIGDFQIMELAQGGGGSAHE